MSAVEPWRDLALEHLAAAPARWLERPIFWPLHEASRHVLGRTAQALVGAVVAAEPGVTVEIRHSARVSGGFHLLRSDVDFALIFRREPRPGSLRQLRRALDGLRMAWPWLGEAEYYLAREWAQRQRLAARFQPIFELHWLLRKWRWQRRAEAEGRTAYHRAKAAAALRRARDRLGLTDASAWLTCAELRLGAVGLGPEPGGRGWRVPAGEFRGYLEWGLAAGPSGIDEAGAELGLPGEWALVFAATLPDGDFYFPGEAARLRALRARPEMARVFRGVCENEILICRSVLRAPGDGAQEAERVGAWVERLERTIQALPAG